MDMIDFMQYIVPTLVVEALQIQAMDIVAAEKARRNKKMKRGDVPVPVGTNLVEVPEIIGKTCYALQCLSKVCRMTEQYEISTMDLIEIDR